MSYKDPIGRENIAFARAGWITKDDGKRRLRTDAGPIRVSTRQDGPREFLTSVKPVFAPQHEGYVDIAKTTSRESAELAHKSAVAAIRAVLGDAACSHHDTAAPTAAASPVKAACLGCDLARAMLEHLTGGLAAAGK